MHHIMDQQPEGELTWCLAVHTQTISLGVPDRLQCNSLTLTAPPGLTNEQREWQTQRTETDLISFVFPGPLGYFQTYYQAIFWAIQAHLGVLDPLGCFQGLHCVFEAFEVFPGQPQSLCGVFSSLGKFSGLTGRFQESFKGFWVYTPCSCHSHRTAGWPGSGFL